MVPFVDVPFDTRPPHSADPRTSERPLEGADPSLVESVSELGALDPWALEGLVRGWWTRRLWRPRKPKDTDSTTVEAVVVKVTTNANQREPVAA